MNQAFLRLRDRLLLLRSLLLRITARSLLWHLRLLNRLLLYWLIGLRLRTLRLLMHLLVRHRLLYGLRMLGRLRGRLLHFRHRREDRLARRIIN